MCNLEDVSKPVLRPLIHGEETDLTEEDQRQISTWFAKTVFTTEFLGGPPYYFTNEDRLNFMTNLQIPYPVVFFLSAYLGPLNITVHKSHLPLLLSSEGNDGPISVDSYSATVSIKHLVLQVFALKGAENLGSVKTNFAIHWKDTFVQIWPIRSERVKWPPPLAFDDDGLILFRDRWANLRP